MAVALTFDFDAHSPWMGTMGRTSPSYLSRGDFGAEQGVPRLLELLGRDNLPATWATPGHDLVTFPHRIEQILEAGHEIAAHGCYHEVVPSLEPAEERRLMEVTLRQHEQVTGRRPRGYRSPAWDFSETTLDLLEEFGFDWDSSLMGREFELYRPRRVTVNYESANTFGPPSRIIEIPVSWYLDDWPSVEYVAGVSALGSHRAMEDRWNTIFDYAHERVPGAVYVLTMHPQTIGRSHHLLVLESLIQRMLAEGDVWFATLSEIADAWQG
ncbi:polysaccharide deacetylase [Nonomuraea sp. MG754425]|nr:polysaccharide deacetylase [Nonomuraea sp. MG754425]